MKIYRLKDLIRKDEKIKDKISKKYNFGYRLTPYENSEWKYLSRFLEFLFYIFKYFQRPPDNNNIMKVNEIVTIARGYKTIDCLGLLDTGNEGPTILDKLGFTDKDFESEYVDISSIGGKNKLRTIYIDYKFCGFIHTEKVCILDAENKYDVIVGQKTISKMYYSGYNLYI